MALLEPAFSRRVPSQRLLKFASLIAEIVQVVFASCEDAPILIQRRTFAALTQERARGSRRTVFKFTFFAAIVSLQKCSATACTAEKKERGALRESLSGRSYAVCLGENLSGLDSGSRSGRRFPPIRLPALQKSRREIFRSRRCPAINHGRS